jgi:hypothetical protein
MVMPLNGTLVTTPAETTPGCRVSPPVSASVNAMRDAPLRYFAPGSETCPLRTLAGRNPGATADAFLTLSPSRVAPARSTNDSAICATRNPCRMRCAERLAVPARDSACSAWIA